MARKSKKRKQDRKKQAFRRAQQKAQRPAGRVRDAMQLLQEGHTEEALNTAKVAFSGAKDASTKENVRSVLVEAHFRTAATKSKPTERLFHLDSALDLAPADDRLHYHRATTLMHLGEIERAEDALEQAAKINPNLSGLTSLSALINSAKEKYVNESEDSGIISTIKGIAKGQDLDRLLESLKKPVFDGQRDVWQALITMSQKPNVAPVDIFDSAITSVAQSDKHQVAALVKEDFPHVSPQIHYYRGVAAMRHKDSATALDAWNQASKGMETAWLQENLDNRLQEKVTDLGHAGEWSAVIDSYEGIPAEQKSKILSEAVSIARFHLGYVAAQQQKWSEAAEHWRIADNTLSNRYLLQNLALAEEALENWEQAATAWREMVKRRPRKKDHPDYLTDEQVAAVWRQAAKCYDRVDLVEEEIICLRNAIKYTPEDTDLRIKLADALLYDDHYEAAENELERILNVDPDYVPALIRLGATYKASWEHDPVPIWRKILTLDPENRQVRNLLAQAYVEHVNGGGRGARHPMLSQPIHRKIEYLNEALEELSNHPTLLLDIGEWYVELDDTEQAWSYFRDAWKAAPEDLSNIHMVLDRLLHNDGEEIIEEMLPHIRQIRGLLAPFWMTQSEYVLEAELDQKWAERFWEEALAISDGRDRQPTRAATLYEIVEMAHGLDAPKLAARYEERVRAEVPESGAVELMDAFNIFRREHDRTAARRLIRRGKRKAQKAGETELIEKAEQIELLLSNRMNSLFEMMNRFGPDDPDEMPDIDDFLDNLDQDAIDELRKLFDLG